MASEPKLDRSDRAMGIRAARSTNLGRLDIDGGNAGAAERYEACTSDLIADLMITLPIAAEDFVFLDLGSGKGRALCLASEFAFKRIVGVEFARELHQQSIQNLRTFSAPWQQCRDIAAVHEDVAQYEIPSDPLVLFMFNPFKARVLEAVLRRLQRSLAAHARPVWILYYMPVHADRLDRKTWIHRHEVARNWIIYRTDAEELG